MTFKVYSDVGEMRELTNRQSPSLSNSAHEKIFGIMSYICILIFPHHVKWPF